ncbi:serine hydrolase [uncultured Psychroserpens sp.]|uniref:serine hydrolase domain-containing protein n=1 Tax=uncultured Psychroserpens sp. TaxID=255436 RepID=UPI002632A586|nr:serine hydrolase domain-containing protein [uncultured Psychroserpens sp.]
MKNLVPFLLSFFLTCNYSQSQQFEKAISANSRLIQQLVKQSNIPGLSIAVSHKNEIIWNQSFGKISLEHQIPTNDSSKFRIASVSKLFTGTAIFKLHKEGKIHLDDYISKYLDSVPNHWKTITIRQIAQHTSGIGHYIDLQDALDTHHYNSTKEALKKFENRSLKHKPDDNVTYSSYAYTVLAAVIEKATNKEFPLAMNDIIFKPLKMTHTEVDNHKKIIEGRTAFYQYNTNRKPEHAPHINLSGRWAGSGYLSTAKDLVKFGMAHTYSSKLFSKKDLTELTSPRKINDSLYTKEGIGWGLRNDWEDRIVFWGDGKTPGSTCGLMVFPKEELSIAIVSNMRNAPIERGEFQTIARRFLAEIDGKSIKEFKPKTTYNYNLDIKIGKNDLKAKLILNNEANLSGTFDLIGIQKFNIYDSFWIEDDLWIFASAGGQPPISLGFLPIKLNIESKKISGQIFRINAEIKN